VDCGLWTNRSVRARAGRFCETNPIRGSLAGIRGAIMQNKPNGAGRQGRCHRGAGSCDIASMPRFGKQSQAAGKISYYSQISRILLFHHPSPMSFAPNKPNFRTGQRKDNCG
jgi:hypothetical protein